MSLPHRKALIRALGAIVSLSFIAVALGTGVQSGAATASADDRLQRLLEYNPGSVQVGPLTVRTPDGAELSLPEKPTSAKSSRTGTLRVAAAERCSTEDLCLFQGQVWEGEKLTLSADCTFRGLWTYKRSNGQTWDKQVGSYINNNPRAGTWATLWNDGGTKDVTKMDNWDLVESHRSAGPSSPSNAVIGIPWGSIISIARVCQP